MKRFDSILLKVFLYGLPALAALAIFAYLYSTGAVSHATGYAKFMNSIAGFVFAMWMTLSIYLSVRLMFSGPFREQVIARITFMRERDEREAILTGRATKATFLTSLAILIFLFCLSCIQVSIYRVPPERAINGKTGFVSLGLGFSLLEHEKQARPVDTIAKEDIFSYRGLPISSQSIILMLILWQILSYNYSMRRLIK
ncbi:MAG TPA: hypothetical protein DCG53_08630 [Syntrophus sp. (in: bacteria)]|jgi:preprotein translocase subunit SecG|nr:hypothetical protein [Syntrophus sp. (in: bacteria)]